MKHLSILALVVVLAGVVLADTESVDSLKAQVDRASPKDQVELCTKIAERQLDVLGKAYNDGNVQQARAVLADVVAYGVRASEQSAQTGKRMKQTEISMRKISARLEGIRKSLDLDERGPVGDAINKLETARTELLNRMFRK